MSTLQARGIFRDFRNERQRVDRIEWRLVRPDRKRLQIGLEAAVVVGEVCWTDRADGAGFRRVGELSKPPMSRLSYVLSDGVSFLVPSLFETGIRAFEHGTRRRANPWVLAGVDWRGDRPCYVVAQDHAGGVMSRVLRVWIDQDQYLVRSWMLHAPDSDGRLIPILGCSYEEVIVDEPIGLDGFQLAPPTEIRLLSDTRTEP